MYRIKIILFTALMLSGIGLATFAQKKHTTIPEKPETKLIVPTFGQPEDTIFVDLSKPVPSENTSMIPLESSLVEEQKKTKKVVIVPAPPPPPGKDPIPPKYPDRKD